VARLRGNGRSDYDVWYTPGTLRFSYFKRGVCLIRSQAPALVFQKKLHSQKEIQLFSPFMLQLHIVWSNYITNLLRGTREESRAA
jgi:hypothetical protein